jgi:nucleotide-binding universal stress UspA family protein
VPLDGTPAAGVAVSLARRLARLASAELVLVRVVSANGSEAAAGQAYLDGVVRGLPADGPRAETLVRAGSPGEAIVAAVQDQQADLIVMATHGRSGLARATAGSVTEHVLTHSAAPVLTLRPGTESRTATAKLLVPVDGTPAALSHWMWPLAWRAPPAPVSCCFRSSSRSICPSWSCRSGSWRVPWSRPGRRRRRRRRRRIAPLHSTTSMGWLHACSSSGSRRWARLQLFGVTAVGRSLIGSPSRTISQVARESEVDLIVMSTHALTGPVRTLLGSVADEVVRTAIRPVLLVRLPRQQPSAVE